MNEIVGIYALYDKINGYSDLKLISNDLAAQRDFRFMCAESSAYIQFNKDDYSLVKIGDFNTITGDLIISEPVTIIKGSDCQNGKGKV